MNTQLRELVKKLLTNANYDQAADLPSDKLDAIAWQVYCGLMAENYQKYVPFPSEQKAEAVANQEIIKCQL